MISLKKKQRNKKLLPKYFFTTTSSNQLRTFMIKNKSTGKVIYEKEKWLKNPISQSIGAMFRRKIYNALVFPLSGESKNAASIHMFFVFTKLSVFWVNNEKVVVDKCLAKPFRVYSPQEPAKYIIEMPPEKIDLIKIGDYLEF